MIDPWVIREKFIMKIYTPYEAFDHLSEWSHHRARLIKLYNDFITLNNKSRNERIIEYKRIIGTDQILDDIDFILYLYLQATPE